MRRPLYRDIQERENIEIAKCWALMGFTLSIEIF